MSQLMKSLHAFIFDQLVTQSFLVIEIRINDNILIKIDTQLCIFDGKRELYVGRYGFQGCKGGTITLYRNTFVDSSVVHEYSEQEMIALHDTIRENMDQQWVLHNYYI